MSRPVPLFEACELLTLLSPSALETAASSYASYIRDHISGDVLVVARSEDRLSRLVQAAELSPETTSVIGRINDTGTKAQIKDHELDIPDGQRFDTIVYSKERTAWFGRSGDFHRLTPLLKHGGTLLGKTKWVPDSERLQLDEIAVTGAYQFEAPEVYLRWTKQQQSLAAFENTTSDTVRADGGDCSDARPADRKQLRTLVTDATTQFTFSDEKTEYSPGWSWHSELQRHVRGWAANIDGPVANLCCGTNPIGDIRVDLFQEFVDDEGETHHTAANVQGDAASVPLPRNSVAAVITDPPWKIDPESRAELFSEAQRITQPGGVILHNAWYIPHHPYATPREIRPVVANVTDTSINGPGGLSFLTEYEVCEQPDFEDATYTLAEHVDECSLAHTQRYRDTRSRNPWEQPTNDPRFVSPGGSYKCDQCGQTQFRPVEIPQEVLYECRNCGYRHSPATLSRSSTTG